MTTTYTIGDIHGQLEMLEHALDLIERDGGPDAQIIFMGDYTDRGPDSRGVLNLLIQGRDANRNWQFLMGNHDRMFEGFLRKEPFYDPKLFIDLSWLNPRLGGQATLESYGLDFSQRRRLGDVHAEARETVPEDHRTFLRQGLLSIETDEVFFVHAGIKPTVPLAEQDVEDLLWIREPFVEYTEKHPKLIVHGHTAVDAPEHCGIRVNTDGGAGYGRPLVPIAIEGTAFYTLSKVGRTPLKPK
jgi:serine/threonine protein phosphatase 1